MARALFHPGREAEELVRRVGRLRQHLGHPRVPYGVGTRLVEEGHRDAAELLEGGAMAEDDPLAGCAIYAADECDRYCENKRTGGRLRRAPRGHGMDYLKANKRRRRRPG